MAPESAAGSGQYNDKVDIYSAAVTFYELFEEASFDPSFPFAFAFTPRKIAPLLVRMAGKDPKTRPPALELIDTFLETNLPQRFKPAGGEGCLAGASCVVS